MVERETVIDHEDRLFACTIAIPCSARLVRPRTYMESAAADIRLVVDRGNVMTERIVTLLDLSEDQVDELVRFTFAAAKEHAPEWLPTLDAARAQLVDARAPEKVGRALLDAMGQPIAWVAAAHAWGCIWELHPLIVAIEHQRRGHGRRLVREIEHAAAAGGALTMILGTSDLTGATSLSGVDLYDDTFTKLDTVMMRRPHPLEFWQRIGYRIVGVEPDAEGPGMPSIRLARRL